MLLRQPWIKPAHWGIQMDEVFQEWLAATARLNIKDGLSEYEIPMLKIRRSWDRVIFIMGISIQVRRYLFYWNGPLSVFRQSGFDNSRDFDTFLNLGAKRFIKTGRGPTWTRLKRQENLNQAAILTHWGRVTHICVVKLTIIGSDNGLSPGRRQAIILTNAGILLIGP